MGRRVKILRCVAGGIWLTAGILFLLYRRSLTPTSFAAHAPAEDAAAAGLVLLLFACKPLTVLFPLKILEMAVGMRFSLGTALLLNLTGAAFSVSTGYWLGVLLGGEAVYTKTARKKRLSALLSAGQGNPMFFAMLLRFLLFLPLDLVSMYFGASRAHFMRYLTGSLLGMLPKIVLSTLLGAAVTDPMSPMFLSLLTIFLLLEATSVIVYFLYLRRQRK